MLKSFKICGDTIKQDDDFQMRHTVSLRTSQKSHSDVASRLGNFHQEAIKTFISALVMELKGAFGMSDLPIIYALLTVDTVLLLASTD